MTETPRTDGAERARLWDTERNLRGWGYVWLAGGAGYLAAGGALALLSLLGVAGGALPAAFGVILGAVVVAWGLTFAGVGYAMSQLHPGVRWMAAAAGAVSFLVGPCGLVSLFGVALLLKSTAAEVLSSEHRALRERTALLEAPLRTAKGGSMRPVVISAAVAAVGGLVFVVVSVLAGGLWMRFQDVQDRLLMPAEDVDEGGWEEPVDDWE